MRKGFTVTLLTVAVAMMGPKAMSIAPVIGNIKDIIVSDDTPVSGANLFVYPDAIDLNSVVSDGDTTLTSLIWSYEDDGDNYLINNAPQLDIGGGDTPLLPPAGKRIAGPGSTAADDPEAVDSNLFTITVRNNTLSPIANPQGSEPGPAGILPAYTDIVTFFVSDEDQYTSKSIAIFTENDGSDRLSPAGGVSELDINFSTGTNGWIGLVDQAANGGTASFQQNANGLCLTVSAAGDNIASWLSPYGIIDLTDNAVYEIRATMYTSQTTEDAIPFWNIGLINLDLTGAQTGANSYGAEFYFMDNLGDPNNDLGGSQGIGRFRNEFVVYWTPVPVSLPSWRSQTTGAFQPAADDFNDLQLSLRVFDLASSGYNAAADSGSVCLTRLQVYRHDLDAINVVSTEYSDTSLASGDVAATGAGNFAYSGGVLTVTPNGGNAWLTGTIDIVPGTGTIDVIGGPQPLESWPLTWDADVLYLISSDWSIPNAGVQTTGIPDFISVMLEGHVQTYHKSYVLPNVRYLNQGTGGAGLPPVAPATGSYKAFGYTNEPSKSSFYSGLRPHILLENFSGIIPDPATGSFSIHNLVTQRVTF